MGSWTYTYVPEKDTNTRHIEARQRQIAGMNLNEAKEHLRRLNLEMAETTHQFRKLLAKPVYKDMMEKGELWKHARQSGAPATMQKLSKMNLDMLGKDVAGIHPRYQPLIVRLMNLPYTLKHNTKKQYVDDIKKLRCIYSLTELHRRGLAKNIQGGTTHEGADDKWIHNEDFVFFRLSIGTNPAHSRFGPECFVFLPDQLFRFGWVSLHDMLSPASTERMCKFPTINKLEDLDNKVPNHRDTGLRSTNAPDQFGVSHRYWKTGKEAKLHRVQEVFYAGDIRRGIALSVVRELNLMMGAAGLEMALKVCGQGPENDRLLLNLISNLFFLEAKVPTMFQFSPHELLQHHSDVPYSESNKN